MRHTPRSAYSGLTIVLQHPSRADKLNLLSAGGGRLIDDFLKPEFSRFQCDIRTADVKEPLIDGTKCILLCGEGAAEKWIDNKDNTLNEIRGSVYSYSGVCAIPTYFPQDAADIKDYEKQFNEVNADIDYEEENELGTTDEKSRKNKTQRKNFRFWLSKDLDKCKRIISNNGSIPQRKFEPNYITYPSSEEVIDILSKTKNEHLYIDIETDSNWNILCFSFSFSSTRKGDIFIVPVLLHSYEWAYDSLHYIFRALSNALRNNCAVAHNGAQFDFMVFALKYRMPIGRNVYDTMIAQHRCYPEVEKSLGHCVPAYELVDTLKGRIKIADLIGKENFYVWSWKDGKPFPAKVKKVFKTRENAELVRVNCWRRTGSCDTSLQNKFFHIDCTPDHLFLVNGQWIKAIDLVNGTRLTRVRIQYGKDNNAYDRLTYVHPESKRTIRVRAHQYIYNLFNPKLDYWEDIHHKDNDKFNNEPTNLEKIDNVEHMRNHALGNTNAVGWKNPTKNQYWCKKDKVFKQVPLEKIVELYTSGMSQAEVGKVFGFSQGQIGHYLRTNNIKARTAKEGQDIWVKKNNNCTVISVEKLTDTQDVYCMEVEDTNCFSCNGVIVHNCTSLWTYEPFHKDEGGGGYMSQQAARKMWAYCGKDVFTMILIHMAQEEYSHRIPGLAASIKQANDSIRPYMIMTMTGLLYDEEMKKKILRNNDRLMMQYLRWIELLIGPWAFKTLNQKSIKGLPGSNTKCCQYFHDMLGYPVLMRSKKTDKPSLGKKVMFKLRLQFDNPVIDIIIAYRETAKESGSLKFNDWSWRTTKQLRFADNTAETQTTIPTI